MTYGWEFRRVIRAGRRGYAQSFRWKGVAKAEVGCEVQN